MSNYSPKVEKEGSHNKIKDQVPSFIASGSEKKKSKIQQKRELFRSMFEETPQNQIHDYEESKSESFGNRNNSQPVNPEYFYNIKVAVNSEYASNAGNKRRESKVTPASKFNVNL